MTGQRPDVGDIHRSFEADLTLNTKSVIHGVGHLPVPLKAIGVRGEDASVNRTRAYARCQRSHCGKFDGGIELDGNILKYVREKIVPFAHVIKHAEAATNRRLAIAPWIIGKAKARRRSNMPAVSQSGRIVGSKGLRKSWDLSVYNRSVDRIC